MIEGPRLSTRVESRWYAAQGWTLVGMTGHPEALLARELGLWCTTVTDLPPDRDCPCPHALDGLNLPLALP